MELKISQFKLPDPVVFNYEELKEKLLQKAAVYEAMVYTEEQVKLAKTDRAGLNRLKKALTDERIKREKEYMQPFAQFKEQIGEIIRIIDKPCAVIDKQIKSFEEQQKKDKFKEIHDYWISREFPDDLSAEIPFHKVFDERWLNASVSMKSIHESINRRLEQIEKDIAVLRSLPSYGFEAEQEYLSSLDIASAVSVANRLKEMEEKKAAFEAEKKACAEQRKAEVIETPEAAQKEASAEKKWIGFQAFLSVEDAKALREFFLERGIQYKSIK